MLIPNVRLELLGNNGSGSTVLCPSYAAVLYRETWGPRLDAEKGYRVSPVPLDAPDRYRSVDSIASEEGMWRSKFKAIFDRKYPDGLRAEIANLLTEDAKLRIGAAHRAANPAVPHESFLTAGCSPEQASALQAAGFATTADLPDTFLDIAEVPGITPDLAMALVNLKPTPKGGKPKNLAKAATAPDEIPFGSPLAASANPLG